MSILKGIGPLKAFINTPLAYLCTRELFLSSDSPRCELYVIATNRRSMQRIRELASKDRNVKVKIILSGYDTRSTGGKVLSIAKLLISKLWLRKALRTIGPEDQIVVSHLSNPYTRLVLESSRHSGVRAIVVDDGTATLLDHDAFVREGVLTVSGAQPRATNALARAEALLFSSSTISSDQISFFSFWPLRNSGPELLPQNTFSSLRARVQDFESEASVYFIGQPLTHNGRLSDEEYRRYIYDIVEHYSKQGLRLVYFPHPRENCASFQNSIDIREPNVPFELYLLEQKRLPTVVASVFSTSIFSVHSIFGSRIRYEAIWSENYINQLKNKNPILFQFMLNILENSSDFSIISDLETGRTNVEDH